MKKLSQLQNRIISCRKCPRLISWCEEVAEKKRAAFADQDYWGGPVPSFGDPQARLLIAGLAPAAHGANRTGRMFTGDRSGDWLYRALHKAGFASQAESISKDDGLTLSDAWITAMVHCAPPQNKPSTEERDACRPYFFEELNLMKDVQVILALGSFGWNGVLHALSEKGIVVKPKPKFGHLAEVEIGGYTLIGSYHPSQQNTFTGTLTEPMFDAVFERVNTLIGDRR